MNINDLKTKQSLCKKQSQKLESIIDTKQQWIDYFTEKQERSLRNSKLFFTNFLAYLIIALTCFLMNSLFFSSCFAGLGTGCLIVSGYQKFIVYHKFKKVVKETQKNLDLCKQNKEKLKDLASEIEEQISELEKLSQSSMESIDKSNPKNSSTTSSFDTNLTTI